MFNYICHSCHQELDKFLIRESKKPKDKLYLPSVLTERDGKIKSKLITVNGILNHPDLTLQCKLIHNRDKNAVQNMLFIVNEIFEKGVRPEIFTRKPQKEQ